MTNLIIKYKNYKSYYKKYLITFGINKNYMKYFVVIFLCCFSFLDLKAGQIDSVKASIAAVNKISAISAEHTIDFCSINSYGNITYYVYNLKPKGFIIITGQTELNPVYGWSLQENYIHGGDFDRIIGNDILTRTNCISKLPEKIIQQRKQGWENLLKNNQIRKTFEQWPAQGTTATEGWLEENWTQNYPYNAMCPVDPVTLIRSIAGCPSVAMGSILNFHATANGVEFSDNDDYYHNYSGRQYMIDDDADNHDFPDFPLLNKLLDTVQAHYNSCQGADDIDKGALVFACGVACTQVYTSSGSGTFGVNQALDAYLKFNFTTVELLDESSPLIYDRIMQNIKDTLPVHLAVVDPGWTMGHNVIIDGYNTDGYFHLNFGWGGPYNGWYLLPDEIPYGLTVIEGAVVDIIPDNSVYANINEVKRNLIYPNPVNDRIYLTNPAGNIKSVSVLTITGITLKTYSTNKGQCEILLPDEIKQGMYLLQINYIENSENFIFIVE